MTTEYEIINIDGMTFNIPITAFPSKRFNQLKRTQWRMYESSERELIHHIKDSASVLELGGCLGVVSCLINDKLSEPSNHIVVEPNKSLIDVLNKNAKNNNCLYQTFNGVLGKVEDKVLFAESPKNIVQSALSTKRMHRRWKNYEVTATTIICLEKMFDVKFDTLVMDVEGHEFYIFEEILFVDNYIEKFDTLMIEFHGNCEKVNTIVSQLKERNYSVIGQHENHYSDYNLVFKK